MSRNQQNKKTATKGKEGRKDVDQELYDDEFPIGPDGKRDYLKQDPPLGGQT